MRPPLCRHLLVLTVLAVLSLVLPTPRALAADPTPSAVAPPISFCVGQSFTCVVPDFNAAFATYDLVAKKWSGGVDTVAAGYALLFFSDQPYALGPALHAAFNFSQSAPSYFSVFPTVVLFRFFEVGANVVFLDGSIKYSLSAGLSANFEAATTLVRGKNIGERYRTALAASRAFQE
jgi:hypothetical protein